MGLRIMAGDEAGPVEADRLDAGRLGEETLVRQDMPTIAAAVGLAPERVAVEEGAPSRSPKVSAPVSIRVTPSGRKVSL